MKNIETYKWFTSDHHFGHSNVIKYENRPFKDINEMQEVLVERWNEKIQPEDNVYVDGDFSFYRQDETKELLNALNGRKHLIWGNHDQNRNKLLKIFDSVSDQLILQIAKDIRIKLSHFPYKNPDDDKHILRYEKYLPFDEGHWLVHGHVHSRWKINKPMKMINVGVDVWDFYPVSHEQIISIIRKCENERNTLPQNCESK